MRKVILGKTGLTVTRTSFGALPIQRLSVDEAVALVRKAYESGICYFDTARAYTDSEMKLGDAFEGMRDKVVISSKSGAKTADGFNRDLDTSLSMLKTDYIDVLQFHNPSFVPRPGGDDGLYDAALKAKAEGKIRHIGITQHSIERAEEAVESGLYETLQYPFNHLATEREIALVRRCAELNVGFICMKAMSGGMFADATVPFTFISQFENAVPIWGMQRTSELEQLVALDANPPFMDDNMRAAIEKDRRELSISFCRSCGYCMPCPVGIPIYNANRMTQLITRSPWQQWVTPEWQAAMERIEDCIHCGACAKKCPYGLKPYETMPAHLAFYREFVKTHV
ncbi:MAG: aldo/keto reductase [Clostridia bacterium]|nr:aldo/keto reductase [Clostridia bacterium]